MSASTTEIAQGSEAWLKLRLGKVTASKISDVMAKGRSGAPSSTRANYMAQLICERLTGTPTDGFTSDAMKWGTKTEPEARNAYAFYHDKTPLLASFVDHPSIPMSGASPDSYVDSDGLLEIKCPLSATHIATLLGAEIDTAYVKQMQWQMEVTGRKWCDFVSYDPRMVEHMRLHVRRVEYDPVMVAEMRKEVISFLGELDRKIAELNAKYPEPTLQAAE